MKKSFFALMAMLAMCGCTVDDGETIDSQKLDYADAPAAEMSSEILFDGRQLTVFTLPVAEWVDRARLGGNQRIEGAKAAVFTATEAGYSSQSTVYRLQSDVRDTNGNAYGIVVRVDDTPYWVAPVFGSDSELLINHYTGAVTIALQVVGISVKLLSSYDFDNHDIAPHTPDSTAAEGNGAENGLVAVNRVYIISGQLGNQQ